MATPPKLRNLLADDFEDMPQSFHEVFLPMFNDFASTTTDALSGGLVAGENVATYYEKNLRVLTSATIADTFPIIIANRLGSAPQCVTVAQYTTKSGTAPTSAIGVEWSMTSDGRLKLSAMPGIAASSEYRVTLKVE